MEWADDVTNANLPGQVIAMTILSTEVFFIHKSKY